MQDLLQFTLAQACAALRKGQFTAEELTQAYIAAIEKGRFLNAFISESFEQALNAAQKSDERLRRQDARLLEGVPLAVKDLYATKDIRTTAASRILQDFVPSYESHVGSNLWQAGALSLGKLNLDEFGMGSSNENSYFGPVVSPILPPHWTREMAQKKMHHREKAGFLVPGGSSGGSSAAVAAGLCLGATATDTGGSIRQPAAFTGTVGCKPTYGLCSRWGIIAFASSMDQAGPIARNVEDCALLLRAMAGHDSKDSTSLDIQIPDYSLSLGRSIKGLKIGIPEEYRLPTLSPEILHLWEQGMAWLQEAGAEILPISLPHTRYALSVYYILAPAEASSNLARYDGVRYGLRVPGKDIVDMYEHTRAAGFGPEVQRRILVGTYVLSSGYYDAYYVRAQKVRTLIKQDFEKAYGDGIDAILTPATPSAAFPIGGKIKQDPIQMYLNDIFTVTANLAGLPALVVPAGQSSENLPLGLQLIGKHLGEEQLFSVGTILEESAGRRRVPLSQERWWEKGSA